MPTAEIYVVRVIRPARGKAHLVKALFASLIPIVEAFEPGVLKYQIFATQEGTIVTQEIYKNAEAALNHITSTHLYAILRKCSEEDLLAQEIETQILEPFVGFELRT